MGWRDRAACLGQPPDWWVTASSDDPGGNQLNAAAVRICLFCPVRRQCWEEAFADRDWGVIRGGIRLSGKAELDGWREPVRCGNPVCDQRLIPGANRRYCTDTCANHMSYLRSKGRAA